MVSVCPPLSLSQSLPSQKVIKALWIEMDVNYRIHACSYSANGVAGERETSFKVYVFEIL